MSSQPPRSLTRREALKTIGTGVVLAGIGTMLARSANAAETTAPMPGVEPGATAAPSSVAPQPFTLPKLPYAFDALEPHIDARTMEIHLTKHHQAYVTNANKALAAHPDLQRFTGEELLRRLDQVPEEIRAAVRNNVGGHVNHSAFWLMLSPHGGGSPTGELATAVQKSFGSFEAFQQQFADAAMKRFGSGWAWLVVKGGKLAIQSTANQDSPFTAGATPVLGLDVWEHAYYLHYQNRRADYVAAFCRVVNWSQVDANYRAAFSA